jgi:hypothetical protein
MINQKIVEFNYKLMNSGGFTKPFNKLFESLLFLKFKNGKI